MSKMAFRFYRPKSFILVIALFLFRSPMFGRKKKKTLDDYYPDHEPYNNIDQMKRVNYIDGTGSVEHKELENLIDEYWDLLHPLVQDFVNSYAKAYEKLAEKYEEIKHKVDSARRALTLEQENVQELADEIRELKKALANEATVRKDLEERLRDERETMEAHFKQEKKALELIAQAKFPEGTDIETIIKDISNNIGSSEEVERLKKRIKELEEKIKEEREENERVQAELSQSFMEKILKADEIIQNLKERLGEE